MEDAEHRQQAQGEEHGKARQEFRALDNGGGGEADLHGFAGHPQGGNGQQYQA